MEKPWEVQHAEGEVIVRNPNGNAVRFKTRKAGVLFGMIASHPDYRHERTELAQALWPEMPAEKQRVNLRQALAHIRDAFVGMEVIDADRETVKITLAPIKVYGDPDFIKDISERLEVQPEDLVDHSEAAGPTDAFRQVLEWSLESDPGKTLELVRVTPNLAQSLRPRDLDRILRHAIARAPNTHPMLGWGLHHHGLTLNYLGQPRSAYRKLELGLEHGEAQSDNQLIIESLYYLSLCAHSLGNFELSVQHARDGYLFAQHIKDPLAKARFKHAAGCAMVVMGATEAGFKNLRSAEEVADGQGDELEAAFRSVHRAVYMMSLGLFDEAMVEVSRARQGAVEHKSWRLELACDFVEMYCHGPSPEGIKIGTKLLHLSEAHQIISWQVNGHEFLGLALEDEEAAAQHLSTAIRLREEIHVPLSPLDRKRRSVLRSRTGG
jgi:tetratricopeptide (TPR) repeat protein